MASRARHGSVSSAVDEEEAVQADDCGVRRQATLPSALRTGTLRTDRFLLLWLYLMVFLN